MPRPFNTAFSHADHDCSDHDCGGAFSLYKQVDTPRVRALNVVGGGEQAARLFRPWEERADTSVVAESEDGDDPEIIIHVPLTSDVKLKSIALIGGSGGSAPSEMRVWINKDDIDFSNVGDVEPLQEWSLNDGGLEALEYPTRYGATVPSERLSLLSRARGHSASASIAARGPAGVGWRENMIKCIIRCCVLHCCRVCTARGD